MVPWSARARASPSIGLVSQRSSYQQLTLNITIHTFWSVTITVYEARDRAHARSGLVDQGVFVGREAPGAAFACAASGCDFHRPTAEVGF